MLNIYELKAVMISIFRNKRILLFLLYLSTIEKERERGGQGRGLNKNFRHLIVTSPFLFWRIGLLGSKFKIHINI